MPRLLQKDALLLSLSRVRSIMEVLNINLSKRTKEFVKRDAESPAGDSAET